MSMNDNEFEELRVEILDLLANLTLEKHDSDAIGKINRRISVLNQQIFLINQERIDKEDLTTAQTLEYYQLNEICLQYYQIRDQYVLMIK